MNLYLSMRGPQQGIVVHQQGCNERMVKTMASSMNLTASKAYAVGVSFKETRRSREVDARLR
jgi:hypothetical protein